jgi:hypothetical protein
MRRRHRHVGVGLKLFHPGYPILFINFVPECSGDDDILKRVCPTELLNIRKFVLEMPPILGSEMRCKCMISARSPASSYLRVSLYQKMVIYLLCSVELTLLSGTRDFIRISALITPSSEPSKPVVSTSAKLRLLFWMLIVSVWDSSICPMRTFGSLVRRLSRDSAHQITQEVI